MLKPHAGSRGRPARLALLGSCLLAAVSCKAEPAPSTQLMVVVDSDLPRIDSVRVLVEGMREPMVATASDLDTRPLPRTVAVVHEGGPDGPIVVIAEAVVATNTVISRRAEVSFLRGRNMMLRLELDASCVDRRCMAAGETCIDGSCRSAEVDEDDLADWSGDDRDAGEADANGGRDGGRGGGGAGGRGGSIGGSGANGGAGSGGRGGAGAGGRGGTSGGGRGGSAAGSGGAPTVCTDCSFASGTSEPHGKLACNEGDCELTCDAGFTDADDQRGNGCERATGTFSWRPTNLDPEASALMAARSDSILIDCEATLTFGAEAPTAAVEVCGRPLEPVSLTQAGGSDIVAFATRRLTVAAGAKLSFAGPRPVAILVYGDADIQGELDVSAVGTRGGAGSNFDCGQGAGGVGMPDGLDPAGGGGGGGFGTKGGFGALSVPNDAPGGTAGQAIGDPQLRPLRGGCPGGAGNKSYGMLSPGGGGGGAIQLSVAGTLRIGGALAAAGGGGSGGTDYGDGGGGGGSGGALLLEANRIEVQSDAWITANGGGGGEGHSWWVVYQRRSGSDGAHRSATPAAGASGYGDGGRGAAGETMAGDAPRPSSTYAGGGGGGGGMGRIVLHAADCQLDGHVSPPASCSPHP